MFASDSGFTKAKRLVETIIKERGYVPSKVALQAKDGGHAWALPSGSAAVMIALNPALRSKPARLRVVSPIVKLREEPSSEMMLELLRLNGKQLPGVAFGIIGDEVVLVTERSVQALDLPEIEEMLALVGHYADEYDDILVETYGGVRICDAD